MYLYYYNFKRQLYADLDGLKKYEFEMMIYHMLKDSQSNSFLRIDIQLILLLFKLFNVAKFRY